MSTQGTASNAQTIRRLGYQCNRCGFKGRQFPQGVCPGCGAADIQPIDPQAKAVRTRRQRRLSLMMLIVLWGYLAYLLWRKLL